MEKQDSRNFISEIEKGESSCIILKGNDILRFSLPGVAALLTILKDKPEILKDAVVFDKIVGKGAAALMIKGGVKEIYADIISKAASILLSENHIEFSFRKLVPVIRNKENTGICPIEELSIPYDNPEEIFSEILKFIGSKKSE